MIFKSIVIQGFKSFASRVTFELPRGVAAVVGPNGSGKSNLSDAIRWVLGEQSVKALRGSRLEDVIFGGSETKRAVGMAEVSITFDNASGQIPLEYEEVTITRRVYRSGESEFFINRAPCRLRDIQELFMDTGIGRGSLSLIGQGEVDSILSARPEERRAFLEEAAGIAKYRARKKEALARLEATETNLVRVRDIIAEVESRLEPLRQQAEAAREFKTLSARLRDIDVQLLLDEGRTAWSNLQAALERQRQVEQMRSDARRELDALEAEMRELSKNVAELDEELERGRDRVEAAKNEEIEANHRGELARETLARAVREAELAAARQRTWDERRAQLSEEARSVELRRGEVVQSVEAEKEELAAAEEAMAAWRSTLRGYEERLSAARREDARLAEALALATHEKAALERDIGGADERAEELHLRLVRGEEEVRLVEDELKDVEGRRQKALERQRAVSQRLDDAQRRLAAADVERKAAEERTAQERARLEEARARRQAIADLEASREGYHRGVRLALEEASKRSWDLKGAVAQLLRVPQELEAAIEVALGAAQQFIVAGRDVDAQEAIRFLKKRGGGRATFLPLASLRPSRLSKQTVDQVQTIPGAVGLAADLVDVDETCKPAADYLLGRVVVAETLEAAVQIGKTFGRQISRVVTKDGDVVVPGGAMTGGSRPNRSEGLIARSRLLDELGRAAAQANRRLDEANRHLAEIHGSIDALRGEIAGLEEDRRRWELELLAMQGREDACRQRLHQLQRDIADANQARQRLDRQTERNAEALALLEDRIEKLAAERQRLAAEMVDNERRLQQEREGEEALRERLEACRLRLAGMSRDFEQCDRDLARIQHEVALAERAAEEEARAIRQLAREQEEARQTIEQSLRAAEEAAKLRIAQTETLAGARARRQLLQAEVDELAARIQAMQAEREQAQEAFAAVRVEVERAESHVGRVKEQLDQHGVDAAAIENAAANGGADVRALKEEARSLRLRIDALGGVNLGSVEEYQEVSDRHAFLTSQRDDLEEAKARLDDVIERLDRESKGKLNETLAAVNAALADTFARLFGGGKASLALSDPSRPLESGIEIFVQPPGKRLQNLLALSGGEKALTAVALLFALLRVRPSPFCVLDEVDAPLDESNLGRFRELLEDYSAQTQFLVITHRQGTMESADALFGVTMEESGVSTVVSLNLDDVKSA